MHYYKFNIADWSLGTSHLSLEEEAIYYRLINFYYDTESPIPLETESVFRRLRFGNKSDIAGLILSEFFEKTDSGWVHERCEKVLKEYRKTAKKNKANGAKGGRPSKDAASKETQDKPSGLPNESQNNPNQEPLTNNHKPITNVSNRAKAPATKFTKPDIVELHAYFKERGELNLDQPQRFYDFYESKNWMVGKNKMKDWKAAVRNWVSRNIEKQSEAKTAQEKRAARNADIFNYEKATTF